MRFAHLADCHIGAWRDKKLKELNLQAFITALDCCVDKKVDFIIISGDLFDTTLPDLSIVKKAVDKIKEVNNQGIPFYITYGSHDFAPNAVSIIDILTSSGLLTKIVNAEINDEKVHLSFLEDPKTGAKVAGLSGRRLGLEKKYYTMLETETLEQEKGFKIFAFHNSIMELRSPAANYPEGVPLSSFPKGFDYYAGGHVHEKIEKELPDYGLITYPGTLFGSTFTDLEHTGKGYRRGFYVIDFEDKIDDIKFIDVCLNEVFFKQINADKKTAKQVEELLRNTANEAKVKDKIALLKVVGKLSLGRPSEVNFNSIKQILIEKQALYSNINRYSLSTEEKLELKIKGENRQEIETNLLHDVIGTFKIDPALHEKVKSRIEKKLTAQNGVNLAKNLLRSLCIEKNEGEKKRDFEKRVLQYTLPLLGLGETEQ
ncbi:MAG: DNA repair exonuclease [Candidatus Bathyarchaeota archaeon]|nr:DNA repair exonuclease [Candidatus Bathyarchaeota archaeon]